MKKKFKKALVLNLGIIFVLLGLLGLFLPFLQGIIFLVIGLILLSFSSPKVSLWLERHCEPYPHLLAILEKTKARILKFLED